MLEFFKYSFEEEFRRFKGVRMLLWIYFVGFRNILVDILGRFRE